MNPKRWRAGGPGGRVRRDCLAIAALTAGIVAPGCALAQDEPLPPNQDYSRGHNVSVLERSRPDYAALGVQLGGFKVFPKLEADYLFNSNTFATPTDAKSDHGFLIAPSVLVDSNWGRHEVRADGGLNLREQFRYGSENEDGWFLRGFGRLDFHDESYATLQLESQKSYIERDVTDFPANAAKPLPYIKNSLIVGGVYQASRFRVIANIEAQNQRYDNVPATTGGDFEDHDRNNSMYSVDLKSEYGISPDAAVFVEPTFLATTYDVGGGAFGPQRDSKQFAVVAGGNFDLTALIRGEIGLGYTHRSYDVSTYHGIDGFVTKTKLEYFISQLTTITFTAHRTVQSVIILNSGGYLETGLGLRLDHELLRNVLLKAKFDYTKQDYSGIQRRDQLKNFSVGAIYFVNHGLGLSSTLSYEQRTSDGINHGNGFDDLKLLISVVLQR